MNQKLGKISPCIDLCHGTRIGIFYGFLSLFLMPSHSACNVDYFSLMTDNLEK